MGIRCERIFLLAAWFELGDSARPERLHAGFGVAEVQNQHPDFGALVEPENFTGPLDGFDPRDEDKHDLTALDEDDEHNDFAGLFAEIDEEQDFVALSSSPPPCWSDAQPGWPTSHRTCARAAREVLESLGIEDSAVTIDKSHTHPSLPYGCSLSLTRDSFATVQFNERPSRLGGYGNQDKLVCTRRGREYFTSPSPCASGGGRRKQPEDADSCQDAAERYFSIYKPDFKIAAFNEVRMRDTPFGCSFTLDGTSATIWFNKRRQSKAPEREHKLLCLGYSSPGGWRRGGRRRR